MSTLAAQQQALLEALFAWPAQDAMKSIADYAMDTRARGLKAYQTNGHVLAERALQAAYPVLARMLGDESFADVARALWHAHPPQRGDIHLWGAAMPAFLRHSEQLREEPYLPDVAAAEWALHSCAHAADREADLSSLALLTQHDPDALYFTLAPGTAVVRSRWPVASMLAAHRENAPTFAEVAQQLRDAVAQSVVVWRAGLLPHLRLAQPGEDDFLLALVHGQSLAQALDAAPVLDFGNWLPMAVQSGLVLGARLDNGSDLR